MVGHDSQFSSLVTLLNTMYIVLAKILCTSQIEASTSPPPWPEVYPGHLTPFPAREGGNLITTHRGWGILIASLDVMFRDKTLCLSGNQDLTLYKGDSNF